MLVDFDESSTIVQKHAWAKWLEIVLTFGCSNSSHRLETVGEQGCCISLLIATTIQQISLGTAPFLSNTLYNCNRQLSIEILNRESSLKR